MNLSFDRHQSLQLSQLNFSERTFDALFQLCSLDQQRQLLSERMFRLGVVSTFQGSAADLIEALDVDEPGGLEIEDCRLSELLARWGFSAEILSGCLENPGVDYKDRNRRSLTGLAIRVSPPGQIPRILQEYFFLELWERGIPLEKFPMGLEFKTSTLTMTGDELPELPFGFGYANPGPMSQSISLFRGLQRLYLSSFGHDAIAARDDLIEYGFGDLQLIRVLLNSPKPILSFLKIFQAGNDVHEYLRCQIREELETRARHSLPPEDWEKVSRSLSLAFEDTLSAIAQSIHRGEIATGQLLAAL